MNTILQWAPTACAVGLVLGFGAGLYRPELAYVATFAVLFFAAAGSGLLLRRSKVIDLSDVRPLLADEPVADQEPPTGRLVHFDSRRAAA